MFSSLIQRKAIVSVDGTFFKKFCLKLVSRPNGSIVYILASLLLPLLFSSMGATLSYSRPLGGPQERLSSLPIPFTILMESLGRTSIKDIDESLTKGVKTSKFPLLSHTICRC